MDFIERDVLGIFNCGTFPTLPILFGLGCTEQVLFQWVVSEVLHKKGRCGKKKTILYLHRSSNVLPKSRNPSCNFLMRIMYFVQNFIQLAPRRVLGLSAVNEHLIHRVSWRLVTLHESILVHGVTMALTQYLKFSTANRVTCTFTRTLPDSPPSSALHHLHTD